MPLYLRILNLTLFLSICHLAANGQSISIQKSTSSIQLDGNLSEKGWKKSSPAKGFIMQYPLDNVVANSETEVQLIYTDTHLYIGAICKNSSKGNYVVQSLKRDFDFSKNDAFAIFIDPFGDATSGYAFAVNPFGAQMDGIIELGGRQGIDKNWDCIWDVEVFKNKEENWWSIEISIPFKSLRFDKGLKWAINFARNDLKRNEVSVWSPVPRGTHVANLSKSGVLNWDNAPPKGGRNIAIIPYAALRIDHNLDTEELINLKPQIGGDAKIAINSSLNIDLTINPDFSQAEVDRQVIDLNRFELKYPEKRLFFLENSDLFANLGNSRMRPFFSRRIGGIDTQPVPILFGARLSGRLNKNWRIGLLGMQTGKLDEIDVQSQNYSALTLQRSILKGSSITAFLLNKQEYNGFELQKKEYNRIAGLEFDFRSPDSKWSAKTFFHYIFSPKKYNENYSFAAKARYRTAKFNLFLGLDAPGENYITDMGFVPHLYQKNTVLDTTVRIPYRHFRSNGYYRIFPRKENSTVDYFGFTFRGNLFVNPKFDYQEHDLLLTLSCKWLNTSKLSLSLGNYAPFLYFPFNLDGLDESFDQGSYQGSGIELLYDTDVRNNFFGSFALRHGTEYLGKKSSINGAINYRKQPWGLFGLTLSQEFLNDFPEYYGHAAFTLIGSKLEFSINRNFFFTTFLQYNTQLNNFNLNSRLQWRIKAMSDFYLTYTSNYRADNLNSKDRALVLKVRYWIGL